MTLDMANLWEVWFGVLIYELRMSSTIQDNKAIGLEFLEGRVGVIDCFAATHEHGWCSSREFEEVDRYSCHRS